LTPYLDLSTLYVRSAELKPPFNYLEELYQGGGSGPGKKRPRSQNEKTSAIDTGSFQNTCGAHFENQVEQTLASTPTVSFLQIIAFPQRPFIEQFTK
jgi:hypothetical protein